MIRAMHQSLKMQKPRTKFNVLVIGKDETLFHEGKETFGDTRSRHKIYSQYLRTRYPEGEIRFLTYSTKKSSSDFERIIPGLLVFGTGSKARWRFLFGAAGLLPRILRGGWRPDIITVQEPWEEGLLGYFLAKATGARFMPQLHFDIFSSHWKHEHWSNPIKLLIAKWIFQRSDLVRVVSQVQRMKLEERLGLCRENVFIVPVGVDFKRSELKPDEAKARLGNQFIGKKLVLFVGRFCEQKNLPLWIQVAKAISIHIKEIEFVLVGDGECMSQIQSLVRQQELDKQVHFLGRVGHRELPDIYAAADLFLLTSNYEGYGRVIVEAFLSSVAVVATACTGPEDLVEDGINGRLMKVQDEHGLIRSSIELLNQPEMSHAFGEAGRRKMENGFSIESLSERLVDAWTFEKEVGNADN